MLAKGRGATTSIVAVADVDPEAHDDG